MFPKICVTTIYFYFFCVGRPLFLPASRMLLTIAATSAAVNVSKVASE